MSNAEKHTTHWSGTDVQKYLHGELSPQEMHQLEKAALDDSFLADALEGLVTRLDPPAETTDTRQGSTLDNDLAGLRTRLNARVAHQKKRVIMSPAMRVAAAILLLAGLAFTAWYVLLDKKLTSGPALVAKEPAATTPQPPTTIPPAPASQPAQNPAANWAKTDSTQPAYHPKPAGQIAAAHPKTADKEKLADQVAANNNTAAAESKPAESKAAEPRKADIPKTRTDSIQLPAIAMAPASGVAIPRNTYRSFEASRMIPNQLVFSGRVLDAFYRPLAGAELHFKGNANGYMTDMDGRFNIRITTEDTARQLMIAKLGYEQTSYTLNTDALTGNIIQLKENPGTLNEVVVSGMGKKRRETLAAPPSDEKENLDSAWTKIFPTVGRPAYLEYLATAKKTLAVDSTIHGTESISFTLDDKGMPNDLKIEHSLSPAHDAGILRLLMEGPTWKAHHSKNARAVVSVSFP